MHILLIHQFYLRPGQGGGSRFNEMTRHWLAAGHEVTVVAGQVDYASGHKPEQWRGELIVEERGEHGERILRVYTPDTYQRDVMGRALATGGFALSVVGALRRVGRADVAVVTSPPLTLAAVALMTQQVMRLPTIFEVRDLWPESAVATGALREGSALLRALYLLERAAYASSRRVVALTPAIARSIVSRGLKPASHVVELPNGAGEAMLGPLPTSERRRALREALGWEGRFVVLYAGAHGRANDLGQLVACAERLREAPHVLLVSVGEGPQKQELEALTTSKKLNNLNWLPGVSRARIVELFDAADCGAAILKRTPTFETVYPNKIFDAMSRARPVLCGVDGVARELVEGSGAGVFYVPEDAASMAAAILKLDAMSEAERAQMGARGRALVRQRFDREAIARRYLALMEQVAHGA